MSNFHIVDCGVCCVFPVCLTLIERDYVLKVLVVRIKND